MKPTVAVLGVIRFPPDRMPEVRPHLKTLVDATHKNDGCLAYDMGEDPFDPGLIHVSELWPDHETLARHLRAPHMEPWRAAASRYGLMDRVFTVYDITGSRPL